LRIDPFAWHSIAKIKCRSFQVQIPVIVENAFVISRTSKSVSKTSYSTLFFPKIFK